MLALSDTAKTDICAALALDPARVHVVSPYAAPVFAPAGGAAERVLARWALDRYVVTVGDIGPRKNLAALAEAVGMLGDPSLELVVVGRAGVDADGSWPPRGPGGSAPWPTPSWPTSIARPP